MSSAFYPLGMNSYNNRSSASGAYKTWKGLPPFANPGGVASSNIRPLTNKDYNNNVEYKAGLPRPIHHYRKGIFTANASTDNQSYNNRNVRSSTRNIQMVGAMQDRPGGYQIHTNTVDQCEAECKGANVISSWQPTPNMTINPSQDTMNRTLCCNSQKNALNRARGNSTIIAKNYYQTQKSYLESRCKTYDQRAFNFVREDDLKSDALYVAQCQSGSEIYEADRILFMNTLLTTMWENDWITQTQVNVVLETSPTLTDFIENIQKIEITQKQRNELDALVTRIISDLSLGYLFSGPANQGLCKRVYYKPSNTQFSVQGGVSSSSQILRKKVNAIEKNAFQIKKDGIPDLVTGMLSQNSHIYKFKTSNCTPYQNRRTNNACFSR